MIQKKKRTTYSLKEKPTTNNVIDTDSNTIGDSENRSIDNNDDESDDGGFINEVESYNGVSLKEGSPTVVCDVGKDETVSLEESHSLSDSIHSENAAMNIDVFTFMKNVNCIIDEIEVVRVSNGELQPALDWDSLKKVIHVMTEMCYFDKESCLLNIGCGNGKTSFQAAYDPGVMFTVGIQDNTDYHSTAGEMLEKLNNQGKGGTEFQCKYIASKCSFIKGNIRMCETFNPFTHIFIEDM